MKVVKYVLVQVGYLMTQTGSTATVVLIGMPIDSLPGHKQAFRYMHFYIDYTSISKIHIILTVSYYDRIVIMHIVESMSHNYHVIFINM